MLPGGQGTLRDHPSPSASLLAGLAATGFGIFIQTICPVLLAVGLFTRFAALALLLQVLVLQMPGHAQLAPYSVALLGWIVVLGPGPLSLDGMFRPGMGATALPLVGLVSRGLAGLTRRIGPAYAFLFRLWIAGGLAAIALGGVKGLTNMLPASMATPGAMAWLPQMHGMAAGLRPMGASHARRLARARPAHTRRGSGPDRPDSDRYAFLGQPFRLDHAAEPALTRVAAALRRRGDLA
jgi:hypothetical protein